MKRLTLAFVIFFTLIPSGAFAASNLSFSRTLSLGVKGVDVTELQRFLTEQGFFAYPTLTGYFGPVTQTAVQKYQSTRGIVASGTPSTTGFGVVGPKTRLAITSGSMSTLPTPILFQNPSVRTITYTTHSPGSRVVAETAHTESTTTTESAPSWTEDATVAIDLRNNRAWASGALADISSLLTSAEGPFDPVTDITSNGLDLSPYNPGRSVQAAGSYLSALQGNHSGLIEWEDTWGESGNYAEVFAFVDSLSYGLYDELDLDFSNNTFQLYDEADQYLELPAAANNLSGVNRLAWTIADGQWSFSLNGSDAATTPFVRGTDTPLFIIAPYTGSLYGEARKFLVSTTPKTAGDLKTWSTVADSTGVLSRHDPVIPYSGNYWHTTDLTTRTSFYQNLHNAYFASTGFSGNLGGGNSLDVNITHAVLGTGLPIPVGGTIHPVRDTSWLVDYATDLGPYSQTRMNNLTFIIKWKETENDIAREAWLFEMPFTESGTYGTSTAYYGVYAKNGTVYLTVNAVNTSTGAVLTKTIQTGTLTANAVNKVAFTLGSATGTLALSVNGSTATTTPNFDYSTLSTGIDSLHRWWVGFFNLDYFNEAPTKELGGDLQEFTVLKSTVDSTSLSTYSSL